MSNITRKITRNQLKDLYIQQCKEIERLNNKIHDISETLNETYNDRTELRNENKRLNNIINELKEWFKGYHKSYAGCKWYEKDYIEFIEHLENELKGSDK